MPGNILVAQKPLESREHVLLKLLCFVVFHRDRLQLETPLHDDNIPFVPTLVQLDYTLRPALWVECGEISVPRLDKLAVKAPWAELWAVVPAAEELLELKGQMTKLQLRRKRYQLLAFDREMFQEMLGLMANRNELTLFTLNFEKRVLQLEFNGLWFEAEFQRETF